MNKFESIDRSAKAILNNKDLIEYFEYKKELINEGIETNEEIEDILYGFIWGCINIENYTNEDVI